MKMTNGMSEIKFSASNKQEVTIIDSPKYAGWRIKRNNPFETIVRAPGNIAKLLPRNKKEVNVKRPPIMNKVSVNIFQSDRGLDNLNNRPPQIREGRLINIEFNDVFFKIGSLKIIK